MYEREYFKAFLECAPDAMVIVDQQGKIKLVNAQTEKLFQYERSHLIGKEIEILIPERFKDSHIKYRNIFFENPITRPMGHPGIDLLGKKKNGEEFRVEISLSPVYLPNKEILIFSSIRDITRRILIEEKLKETELQFKRAFEASLAGIIKFDDVVNDAGEIVDFKYFLINKRALELIQKKREEVDGKTMLQVYPDLKDHKLFKIMVDTSKTGNTNYFETPLVLDGITKWYKASFLKMDDGILVNFDDISIRKSYENHLKKTNIALEKDVETRERELSSSNERLRSINKKLDQYAYMISHDLKAPLANIEGIITLIEYEFSIKPLGEEGKQLLEMQRQKVGDMRSIIDGVLMSAKDEIKNKEGISLRNLVYEVIDTLKPPPHFHIHVQHTLPRVKYNRTSLYQILQNLFSNAIKYNDKEQPLISVSWTENEDFYLVCVADNGMGIQEDKLNDIFNFLEVAHNGTDSKESHGIGLAIVKQLVEENGGRIWADSYIGKGSRFHFTIAKA